MAALMARTRYGSSPWLDGVASRKPTYPRPAGTLEFPVAIVGGGLTGSLTAYACAAAGMRVALIEADFIGRAATAFSGGIALPDLGTRYREDERQHGRRASRAAWQAMRRACLDLQAAIKRLDIRCGIVPADSVAFATSTDAAGEVRRELQARRDAGLDATWIAPRSLARFGIEAAGGLAMRAAARLDPLRAASGFARAAAVRGAAVFERTPVSTIKAGRRGVELIAGRATLRVEQVVIATGDPIDAYRALRRHAQEAERYAVMTAALGPALRKLSADHEAVLTEWADVPHRLQWRENQIVWTGTDGPRTKDRSLGAALVQRTGQLMYELSLLMPEVSGTPAAYGWRMPYGRTADGWPLVGAHRNFPRHLFAFGLGDSVTGSYLASRILLRQLAGNPERADEVFGFSRVSSR
jgi:glycine/D-amino acid oxidase-like deaminating enzyme